MKTRGVIDPITGITDGKLRTLIKSNLRPIWTQTSRNAFIKSVRYRAKNPRTGNQWFVVDCCDCQRVMGQGEKEFRPLAKGGMSAQARSCFEVDHIHGIASLGDIRETLGDHFYEMIYGQMEIVCYSCHKIRTAKQTKERNTKWTALRNSKEWVRQIRLFT